MGASVAQAGLQTQTQCVAESDLAPGPPAYPSLVLKF